MKPEPHESSHGESEKQGGGLAQTDKSKAQSEKLDGKRRHPPNPFSMLGAGVELAGAVGLMALGGWWLDGHFDTSPIFLLTGLFVGLVGGLYNLWKQAQRFF